MEKKAHINSVRSKTPWVVADAPAHRTSNGVKIFTSAIFAFAFLAITPQFAYAANLYFSPSSGSHAVGTTFSVSVYVSSADQAMNVASGIISFPQDKLEVTSLSKAGSIFTLWVQEPSFSNSAGTVNFEVIMLNPGFTGASGKVIAINFRVKAAGAALLNFSSGSAFANDGKGTNILASLGNAQFSFGVAAPAAPNVPKVIETEIAPAPSAPTSISGAPSAPQISSATHPDSNKWYNNKNPQFFWTLPSGVNGVSIYFSQSPTSNPNSSSDGLFATKSYENVEDGIWYSHIKMRNSAGWGPVTHFKIQIDTQPPEPFEIQFVDGKDTDNPRPTALFDIADSLSGIDYYKVKIGEGDFFSVAPEVVTKSHFYTLPPQAPGKRNILVQVFDKAGNYTVATEEFVIKPLKEPTITEYPKELQSGEPLIVRGSTYSNSQVIIWFQREGDEASKRFAVQSDKDGKFTFVADEGLRDGIYKMWADVMDERGARSLPSEKITIAVVRPAIFRIGTWAVSFLAVVVPLIALIFVLLFIIWHGLHKFSALRKRFRKEVREAESALHKAFDLLKDDIRKQIKMLEKTRTKRQLTKEEERIIKQLKSNLDDAEKYVRKEIEDI